MSRLQIKQATLGTWQENCYLLACPDTNEAALIDPGAEFAKILRLVGKLKVSKILLTHTDIDHIGALDEARETFRVPVYVHRNDLNRTADAESPRTQIADSKPLREGQTIRVGSHTVKVFDVPGHTPGHVVFLLDDRAIVGDSIFPGGPGRTRTPEALAQALYNLQRVVFRWPDRTTLYPGHGKRTTVGAERENFMRFLAKPRAADAFGDVSWT